MSEHEHQWETVASYPSTKGVVDRLTCSVCGLEKKILPPKTQPVSPIIKPNPDDR